MTALKVRKIGNSTGVILPKEVLDRHNISPGDIVQLSERGAELVITRDDDAFSRQMEAARHVMRRRFSALRELAK
ncbi:MAG: AbrB/MazE/SpoVT family DNA-binding domain-containing protein [Bosea sp. (in: a-proteobacteria)]